jgi:hypothetical protein
MARELAAEIQRGGGRSRRRPGGEWAQADSEPRFPARHRRSGITMLEALNIWGYDLS